MVVRTLAFLILRQVLGLVGPGQSLDAKDVGSQCCTTNWAYAWTETGGGNGRTTEVVRPRGRATSVGCRC